MRRTGLAASVIAFTLAALWWWLHTKSQSGQPAEVPLAASNTALQTNHQPAATGQSRSVTADTVATARPIEDDLCGITGTRRYRLPGETYGQHLLRSTSPTRRTWRNNLAAADSDRLRALALALADVRPELDGFDDPTPDTDAQQQLILRALDGTDPAVYSLALGVCGAFQGPMPPGVCQGLSFEQWARLDPDNAIPWLWLATRAPAGSIEVDDYLARASNASRFDTALAMEFTGALDALPTSATPLELSVAGSEMTSLSRLGEPVAVVELCDAAALRNSARRQNCNRVAHRYAKQSVTLMGAAAAAEIAHALDWPPEEVNSLEQEVRHGIDAVGSLWRGADENHYRCALVARRADYYQQLQSHQGNERLVLAALSPTPDAEGHQAAP